MRHTAGGPLREERRPLGLEANRLEEKRGSGLSPRELAFCGLLGAAALLLPALFHMIQLGRVFMPMYLPLMLLAFFVRPLPAVTTALLAPLLSGALTGMPPFFPPVAPSMALELAAMAALVAGIRKLRPRGNEWLLLGGTLIFGRFLYVGTVYAFSLVLELPAPYLAGVSFVAGWPGIVLMMAVIPPVARLARSRTPVGPVFPEEGS
jgi:hypothetical protein